MKRKFSKWAFRLVVTGLFLVGFLVGIVLSPSLLYANKTVINNYTIFHNAPLDKDFVLRIENATETLRASEIFDANYKLDICLNDGSCYPALLEKIRGQAFGWGFANKVVLMGNANCKDNYAELNGYKWNLTQLLSHEVTHCMQFHKFGFWKSNPVANYPDWKWEGYAEYVARKSEDQLDLLENISRNIETIKLDNAGWAIYFSDSTIAPKDYYKAWLLIQYCIDVKKMSYENILNDTVSEQNTETEMMEWYTCKK